MIHDCLIAFGSNEGDSQAILQDVVSRFQAAGAITQFVASEPLQTAPVGGPENQRDYVNACFRFRTHLEPVPLFSFLVEIETELGRQRRQRWGSRVVDLDLLLYGELACHDHESGLEVPHPRMTFRRFVLEPAVAVASEMTHVVARMTLAELLQHIESTENRICLWGCPDPESVTVVKNICLENEWGFVSFDPESAPGELAASKLNVYFESEKAAVEPVLAGNGPLLKLTGDDPKAIQLEIAAAINGMSRC